MDPLPVEHEARQETAPSPVSAKPRRHVRFQLDPEYHNAGQESASRSRMRTRSASKASRRARPPAAQPAKKRKTRIWSLGYVMTLPMMYCFAYMKNLWGNKPRGISGLLCHVTTYFRAIERQHHVQIYVRWVNEGDPSDKEPFVTIRTVRSARRPAPPNPPDETCRFLQSLLEEDKPPKWRRSFSVPWQEP